MFTRSKLIFWNLKTNIKEFLATFGDKKPGVHDVEYKEALSRYKELVEDYSFQERLQELSFLEGIIIQSVCMQEMKFTLYDNHTSDYPCMYSRANYFDPKYNKIQVTTSVGPRSQYPGNVNKYYNNPEVMSLAKKKLLNLMEKKFLYDAYKIRYPFK